MGKLTSSETAKETPPLEVPSNLVIIAPLKFADFAKLFACFKPFWPWLASNTNNDSKISLKNNYKFAEIASSLAYYLKSFSNINKFLDYIRLTFKHIFNEKIIFIIPLNN